VSVISEGIVERGEKGISFGDYLVRTKIKIDGFERFGDVYNVRTHDALTRLEKNGRMLIETIPGSAVIDFKIDEKGVRFSAEGLGNTSVTLELEPSSEYRLYIDGFDNGKMKTNNYGKISFSIELAGAKQDVEIRKI
jgi:hypothetical protein